MHKEFLRLLEKAKGRSEYVIAINLDIRGFTPFSQSVESLPIATYIKKVYLKIIKEYFKDASYYKPTGDGLIIIMPYTEQTLKDVSNSTVESCLSLVGDFASLLAGDPMINYSTPKEIGIGLTRGCACCITSKDDSEEKTLDYSGRILNLASRLMDLARPSGIVLDDGFGIDLLKDETKEQFSEDVVYIRGVAEEQPMKIYYTEKRTLIPDLYHQPLKEPRWVVETVEYSMKTIRKFVAQHWKALKNKPLDQSKIEVKIVFPHPTIENLNKFYEYSTDMGKIRYKREGSKHRVGIDSEKVVRELDDDGVAEDTIVRFEYIYPVS